MPSERLKGQVDRVAFHNPANGFTIAQVLPEGGGAPVTVVGAMADPKAGEAVEILGSWTTHPRYGRQLKIESWRPVLPSSVEGIERYLASGLIPGIGPVTARRIVEEFGERTLTIIDGNPRRLLRVAGLGRKRVSRIAAAWAEQRMIREVIVFLQSHGVGTGHAVRIYRQYGQEAIQAVRSNPYRLEREVGGIGFLTADRIASRLGMAASAPERVQAGIRYLLTQAADEGNAYLPEAELVDRGAALLRVGRELLPPALECLRADGGVTGEVGRCYLPAIFQAEIGAAQALWRLQEAAGPVLTSVPARRAGQIELSEGQQQAVLLARQHKVMVLTGGPGTGKTTVTRSIVECLEANGLKVMLCSPTGRAARRLADATGREARTIHRLLEYLPAAGRFQRDEAHPVEADAVVVDEASMVDLALMHALLRALPPSARLALVGDVDQLPSIGPGQVMRDIIASGRVPVARLTQIHRQGAGSQIVRNAHRVNQGEWPLAENRHDGDFFVMEVEEPDEVAAAVEDLCARRLPEHGGYDPLAQIQVLTPMYRGQTGAVSLNRRLQRRLNPAGRAHQVGERELRVGDKVMQVRNDYEKGVFNGDGGRIAGIDADEQVATVAFDGGPRVEYAFEELDELVLAYAISIHRSQGSEFPVVVMPLTTQHYVMLQRNLLYTAITRARRLMVIVGSRRALRRAVENNQVAARHAALRERLVSGPTGVLAAGLTAADA